MIFVWTLFVLRLMRARVPLLSVTSQILSVLAVIVPSAAAGPMSRRAES